MNRTSSDLRHVAVYSKPGFIDGQKNKSILHFGRQRRSESLAALLSPFFHGSYSDYRLFRLSTFIIRLTEPTYDGSLTVSSWKDWARNAMLDADLLTYLVWSKTEHSKEEVDNYRAILVKGKELAEKDWQDNDSKPGDLFHFEK